MNVLFLSECSIIFRVKINAAMPITVYDWGMLKGPMPNLLVLHISVLKDRPDRVCEISSKKFLENVPTKKVKIS